MAPRHLLSAKSYQTNNPKDVNLFRHQRDFFFPFLPRFSLLVSQLYWDSGKNFTFLFSFLSCFSVLFKQKIAQCVHFTFPIFSFSLSLNANIISQIKFSLMNSLQIYCRFFLFLLAQFTFFSTSTKQKKVLDWTYSRNSEPRCQEHSCLGRWIIETEWDSFEKAVLCLKMRLYFHDWYGSRIF